MRRRTPLAGALLEPTVDAIREWAGSRRHRRRLTDLDVVRTLFARTIDHFGVIELPVGTFSDPVVVITTEYVQEGQAYESEVGAEIGDVTSGGPLPDHFRPLFDVIHELRQQRRDEN